MSAEETIRDFLEQRIDRREFISRLRAIGVTVGAAVSYAELLSGCATPTPAAAAAQETGIPYTPVALDAPQYRTVEAIAGRILPTTDTPGAIDAGAPRYIDQALATAYVESLPHYRDGIAALDKHCHAQFTKSFADLAPEQQDRVLETLEAGNLSDIAGGAQFFALVRQHVLEGVFCEPYYAGNRDLVGWKLVAFPGQRYGYDDPYINRVVDLPPIAVDGAPVKGA